MSVIAERIKQRRKELGLSQEALAYLLGTSQKQISRYETGNFTPNATMIIPLADALETTTDYLLGRVPYPEVADVIPNNLASDEKELIEIYRHKSPEKRQQARDILRVL